MKTCISIIAVVCALGGTAFAQDDSDTTGSSDTSTESAPVESTPPESAPVTASSGGGGYKMGIGATLNGAADVPELHFFYRLGSAYLDSSVAFVLENDSPTGMGDSETTWAIALKEGYRMTRALSNRIRPYLEPYGLFALSDAGAMSDTSVAFGVGAMFGVEFELFDQFTLGTALGAELDYQTHARVDGVDVNSLRTFLYTTQIDATFWW